jgi:DivIVA domain-containing protein
MSGERRTVTSSPARLSAEDIANRAFSTSFRGFSEQEVRSFLRRIGDELQAAQQREQELRDELDELRERIRHPKPLDESELLEALGEETAQLLRSARDAAKDIRGKADDAATRLRSDAQADAQRMRDEAAEILDVRTREADVAVADQMARAAEEVEALRDTVARETAQLREAADRDAETLREETARAATAEIDAAKAQGRSMHEQARMVRERVIADLTHRRDLLQGQIAELRAGREHLLEAYRVVKRTFLEATEALAAVEARFAETRPEPVDAAEIEAALADDALGSTAPELAHSVEPDAIDLTEDHADSDGTTTAVDDGAPPGAGASDEHTKPETDAREPADVNGLFARIRAEARAGTSAPPEVDAEHGDAVASADADTGAAVTAPPIDAGPRRPDSPDATAATDATDAAGVAAARVQELLSAALKRTKRAAQDEQNRVLDALRRQKGRPRSDAVLPDVDTQVKAWHEALGESVAAAYGASGAGSAPEARVLELVRTVVGPLRERLVTAIDSGDADDVTERVNARYREWKSQELDSAVLDALSAAYATGSFDAASDDDTVQWVLAEDGCCADCADNTLETVRKGAAFPTGSLHPPAHEGCRCTVAVVATIS